MKDKESVSPIAGFIIAITVVVVICYLIFKIVTWIL